MKYHLFFFHKYNIHLYLLTTFFISITTNLCIRIESCNLRITLIFDSNCFLLYLHFFQPSLRPPLSLYYFSLSLSPVLNFFLFLIPRDNKSSRVAGRIGSFRLRRDDDDDGNYDDVVVDDARNGMSLFLPRSFFLWAALILRYEPVGGRLRARLCSPFAQDADAKACLRPASSPANHAFFENARASSPPFSFSLWT